MANFKLVNISGGDLSYKSFRMRRDESRDVDEIPALVTELNGLNPQKTYVSVIAMTDAVVEDTPVVVDDTAEREAAQAEAERVAAEQIEAERLAAEQAAQQEQAAKDEEARIMRELEEQEEARRTAEAAEQTKQEEAKPVEQPKVEPKADKKR